MNKSNNLPTPGSAITKEELTRQYSLGYAKGKVDGYRSAIEEQRRQILDGLMSILGLDNYIADKIEAHEDKYHRD